MKNLSLSWYVSKARQYKILTAEEEAQLFVKYQKGDDKAFNQLVNHNLLLVLKIAHTYKSYCKNKDTDLADLVQAGSLGLMRAIKKFKINKGNRLSTYAQYWIKACIRTFVQDNQAMVRLITTNTARKLFRHQYKITTLQDIPAHDRQEAKSKLAKEIKVSVSEIDKMAQRCVALYHKSWNAPAHKATNKDNDLEFGDTVPVSSNLEDDLIRKNLPITLKQAMSVLSPREKYVVEARASGCKRGDIGKELGVSVERVYQIQIKAMVKVRKKFASMGIYSIDCVI